MESEIKQHLRSILAKLRNKETTPRLSAQEKLTLKGVVAKSKRKRETE